MNNRKEVEKFIIDTIYEILPTPHNKKIYEDKFAEMSDKQFGVFLEQAVAAGGLHLIVPAGLEEKLSTARNIKIGKKLGHDFMQHITMTDEDSGVEFTSPNKYLVVKLGCRRPIQTIEHKRSVPTNLSHVDERTGQATGPSKGSRISGPEINILHAQGSNAALLEFLKTRGGDAQAFNLMNRSIIQNGGVSQQYINNLNTRPKATKVLQTILTAMHYDNNLASPNKAI